MPVPTTSTARSREAAAFLDALQYTAPQVVTACEGWTTHEITAHLAGNAAEITRHLTPYLQGEPVPKTQSFEIREARFQALDDAELRRQLEVEEGNMRHVIDQVLAREPGAVIPWTGRQMRVAKFIAHEILVRAGRAHDPDPDEDFHVRLRAEGAADVRLAVESGQAALRMTDEADGDEPYVELDAAARSLVIWGRRPDQRGRFISHMPAPMLARLQALLSGY